MDGMLLFNSEAHGSVTPYCPTLFAAPRHMGYVASPLPPITARLQASPWFKFMSLDTPAKIQPQDNNISRYSRFFFRLTFVPHSDCKSFTFHCCKAILKPWQSSNGHGLTSHLHSLATNFTSSRIPHPWTNPKLHIWTFKIKAVRPRFPKIQPQTNL